MHAPINGSRRHAREFALLGVYQSEIDPDADFAAIDAHLISVMTDEGETIEGCDLSGEDFEKCDKALYERILSGVLNDRAAIVELVQKHVDRDLARLSVVERSCLMIGAWELVHCPETPGAVVINEAVELSKQFGAEKGYRLVNGVLDKVALDVRPTERKA